MDFTALASKRCSVRQYLPDEVEKDKLQKILEAGRLAPTACNNQPQKILVVDTPQGMEQFKSCYKTFGAPMALVVCADQNQSWKRPGDGKDSGDIDATIVTDHMMLKAEELGISSVWVCNFDPMALRREFNIPQHIEPVNVLILGYAAGALPSENRHSQTRKPLDQTVVYGSF